MPAEPLPEPTQRLPAQARSYWATTGAFQGLGLVLAALIARGSLGDAGVDGWWTWLPLAVAAVGAALLVAVLPPLRWRRWRYEVRDEEIDLRHGALVVRRTLIPIRRVQHVNSEAGPLQDSYGLATVTFHTAAGGVQIPALGKEEAESVRARVAELARTRDDT